MSDALADGFMVLLILLASLILGRLIQTWSESTPALRNLTTLEVFIPLSIVVCVPIGLALGASPLVQIVISLAALTAPSGATIAWLKITRDRRRPLRTPLAPATHAESKLVSATDRGSSWQSSFLAQQAGLLAAIAIGFLLLAGLTWSARLAVEWITGMPWNAAPARARAASGASVVAALALLVWLPFLFGDRRWCTYEGRPRR